MHSESNRRSFESILWTDNKELNQQLMGKKVQQIYCTSLINYCSSLSLFLGAAKEGLTGIVEKKQCASPNL